MVYKKGFTLLEIIVVLIIISIAAAMVYPNYYASTQKSYGQAAENNLLAIYTAQLHYFNDRGGYCLKIPCSDTLTHINTNLNLNISDNVFTYNCGDDIDNNPATAFMCVATSTSSNTILKIYDEAVNLTPNGTVNPICFAGSYCPDYS